MSHHNQMERFTQRARRVLSLAQEEAERLRHAAIDSGHLLLGLLREEGGVAGHALQALGLLLPTVRSAVEARHPTQRDRAVRLDLSPGVKRVLEGAVNEARRLGHHYIGTEHLLLGLTQDETSTAMAILASLGVDASAIRRQVRRTLQQSPTGESSTSPAASWNQLTVTPIPALTSEQVTLAVFSPDGGSFACVTEGRTLHLWTLRGELSGGEAARAFSRSYDSDVTAISLALNGVLALGLADGTVKLLSADDGAEHFSFDGPAAVSTVELAAHGLFLSAAFADHSTRLWQLAFD